jgi:hypothetical protein
MARTKQCARRSTGPPKLLAAIVFLKHALFLSEDELEEAAAAGDVAELEHLLSKAASDVIADAGAHGTQLRQPSAIHLASMCPVPEAVECLVAAGASVLEQDSTVTAWETTDVPTANMRRRGRYYWSTPMEAGPSAVYQEEHQQYSCLLLAAKHSPSLDTVSLLVRTTLQQAKQQWRQQQQQQQSVAAAATPWGQVMCDLVRGALACRHRRAALVLQQVVELEGVAAGTRLVDLLLEAYSQLRQGSRREQRDLGVEALTHLAQVLLLAWLEEYGKVVQQREGIVSQLQRVGAVPLRVGQQALTHVQQAAQKYMPTGWGPVHASLWAVEAATVAAAEEPAGTGSAGSSTGEDPSQTIHECQLGNLSHLIGCVMRVWQLQACPAGSAADEEQLRRQRGTPEEEARWAAAEALADLLDTPIAARQHAVVEAAAAELCRQLLAAWLAVRKQLHKEVADAVAGAAERAVAGKRT